MSAQYTFQHRRQPRLSITQNRCPAMNRSASTIRATLLFLSLLGLVAGCRDHTSLPPASAPAEAPQTRSRSLLKIVIMQDKSGSTATTRTQQLTVNDLEPLLEILGTQGESDLGVAIINDNSDRPLLRVRIPVPPEPPTATPEDSQEGNPFDRLYENEEDKPDAVFDKQVQHWKTLRNDRLAAFRAAAEPLLAQKAQGLTDIEGALARADQMLAEEELHWKVDQRHLYLLLITDGIPTVRRLRTKLKSTPTVLMVNGSGSVGALARLNPLRFESPQRAIQYIRDKEGN